MSSWAFYEEMRRAHEDAVRGCQFERASPENLDPAGPNRGYVLRIDVSQFFPQYEELVSRFVDLEPDQYYFPRSDLHITVFEFVSARPDYLAHEPHLEIFRAVCQKVLANWGSFEISLRGTVFTRTSGIVAGIDNDRLIEIRSELRSELHSRGVQPLERYESRSAHVSFMAFRESLRSPEKFLALVEATKDLDLGRIHVSEMELVEQDWFSRAANRRTLGTYRLGSV